MNYKMKYLKNMYATRSVAILSCWPADISVGSSAR